MRIASIAGRRVETGITPTVRAGPTFGTAHSTASTAASTGASDGAASSTSGGGGGEGRVAIEEVHRVGFGTGEVQLAQFGSVARERETAAGIETLEGLTQFGSSFER